jgi:hypothetical protein
MDIEQVKKQHQEGLAKLGVLLSQKEQLEGQVKDLKSQLLQLEAIQQWAESNPPASTASAEASEGGE